MDDQGVDEKSFDDVAALAELAGKEALMRRMVRDVAEMWSILCGLNEENGLNGTLVEEIEE